MSRWLVAIGLVLVVVGLLWPWLRELGRVLINRHRSAMLVEHPLNTHKRHKSGHLPTNAMGQ
jgi:hypothetical protein